MLYAISGSQGCGKTTTLLELSKRGFEVVERKTSRSILTDWNVSLSEVNNNRELTVKFQEEILKRKYEDEMEAAASGKIVFTERTYADLFTYALVALGKDNEYSDWLDSYHDRCVQKQHTYAGVFYLAAGFFAPVNDGVRGINQHYSRMVDMLMEEYTRSMSCLDTTFTIRCSGLEQRVGTIMDHLDSLIEQEPTE